MKLRIGGVVVGFLLFALSLAAQTASSASAASQVPPLIPFSGVASDEGGNSLSGVVNLTFSLYAAQQGGAPLWTETQNNVQLDPAGHYSVQLGITKPNGVPTTLFTTGEARWLGVRIAEQGEQPRMLLLSVPYALKAGDAATIGGLPPSAFVLAGPLSGTSSASGAEPVTGQGGPPPSGDVTGTGTVNYLPLWDSTSDIISSVLYQKGTGKTAKIGINTITPASTLDVKGGGTIRGTLSLPSNGTATATAGKNSQPLNLAASAFNSTSSTAVNQTFQWQSEPVGNNTSTPSGTLNLLFGEGATKPSETGLNIASNGQIKFATGQTFPGTGTGDGTVTSVATGLGLKGGPITTSGTLTIDTSVVPQLAVANTFAANQTVNGSVTATSFTGNGSGLTNVTAANSNELGGLSSSAYAQLAAANTFTANQTVTGEITAGTGSNSSAGVLGESLATSGQTFGVGGFTSSPAGYGVEGLDVASSGGTAGYFQVNTGSATILQGNNGGTTAFRVDSSGDVIAAGAVSGSAFQIGGQLFDYGSFSNSNAFLGFAGNTSMTGGDNTAIGAGALVNNGAGLANTASGVQALELNCISIAGTCGTGVGSFNTAAGYQSLAYNTTGSANTATGGQAGITSDTSYLTGDYDTALGFLAGFSTGTLSNATAVGAFATVSESNALVLGNGANVGIGTSAPTAALDVVGNSLQALIGDAGCGSGFAGVGFVNKGGFNSCKNYALLGDAPGNLYLNSSLTGSIYFRNNNGTLMTIDTSGDVNIKGNLSKGGGSFKIDDPLDPANKYLYHSFVESPDMMNVYNGNITTNKAGLATVVLPHYFEALNRDFRYQLTVIGQFAQAIVAKEVSQGRFTIKTNRPGVKVSWQVTGIRQDAYANAHRIPTEVEKPPQEQGHYLHPELFGAGPELAVGYDGSQSPAAALGGPAPTAGSRP